MRDNSTSDFFKGSGQFELSISRPVAKLYLNDDKVKIVLLGLHTFVP